MFSNLHVLPKKAIVKQTLSDFSDPNKARVRKVDTVKVISRDNVVV